MRSLRKRIPSSSKREITISNQQPLSDLEVREQSLTQVCDALAVLQQVPAAGLDEAKHETVTDMVDDARSLERFVSAKYVDWVERWLQTHGYVVVGVSGISPLPFKMFCTASGVFDLELKKMLGVSFLFRGFRFFSIAFLLAWYDDAIVAFVRNQFWIMTTMLGLAVVLSYVGWQRFFNLISDGLPNTPLRG